MQIYGCGGRRTRIQAESWGSAMLEKPDVEAPEEEHGEKRKPHLPRDSSPLAHHNHLVVCVFQRDPALLEAVGNFVIKFHGGVDLITHFYAQVLQSCNLLRHGTNFVFILRF